MATQGTEPATGCHYVKEGADTQKSTCIIFSPRVSTKSGALARSMKIFEDNGVNLLWIEQRSSKRNPGEYEFIVECKHGDGNITAAVDALRDICMYLKVISRNYKDNSDVTPWFPGKIRDLDKFNKVLSYGAELDSDHPGFTDPVYTARRTELSQMALKYKYGLPIPRVEYTPSEIETWGKIFRQLTALHPTHACREYRHVFPLLVESCGYREDNIPQLQEVSDFLKDCTGFTLRPVTGLVSPRDFLAGLAFRVFHSTQYVRHPKCPYYTPEPDICHELLGHVPLFCDPDFAEFSQEIGLASLGAPDEDIEKLATCYWFTVEYGLCRQNGEIKAYGAALLSAYGELEYCLSGKPELRNFDPEKTGVTQYPLTEYQPIYFVAESFEDAKQKLRQYAKKIKRPFAVRYNPYTSSVEILDSKPQVDNLWKDIKHDIDRMQEAIERIAFESQA